MQLEGRRVTEDKRRVPSPFQVFSGGGHGLQRGGFSEKPKLGRLRAYGDFQVMTLMWGQVSKGEDESFLP